MSVFMSIERRNVPYANTVYLETHAETHELVQTSVYNNNINNNIINNIIISSDSNNNWTLI